MESLIISLVVNLAIPLTMIGLGESFKTKKAYEKTSTVSGYRTSMSMKNQDTWEFAHRFCGTLLLVLGIIALPATVVFMLSAMRRYSGNLGTMNILICGVQLILLVGSVLPTEIALRVVFDKNGERRN